MKIGIYRKYNKVVTKIIEVTGETMEEIIENMPEYSFTDGYLTNDNEEAIKHRALISGNPNIKEYSGNVRNLKSAMKEGNFRYDKDAGCTFVITGEKEIAKFDIDNNWIKLVRSESKRYPGCEMYYVESQRAYHRPKMAGLDKCVAKIKEQYPMFEFKPIEK